MVKNKKKLGIQQNQNYLKVGKNKIIFKVAKENINCNNDKKLYIKR